MKDLKIKKFLYHVSYNAIIKIMKDYKMIYHDTVDGFWLDSENKPKMLDMVLETVYIKDNEIVIIVKHEY